MKTRKREKLELLGGALAGKRAGVVLATKFGNRRSKGGRNLPSSGRRCPERGVQMASL
jgi:aryl-alcohol dehydrogenase-like predicted oxidoreductase